MTPSPVCGRSWLAATRKVYIDVCFLWKNLLFEYKIFFQMLYLGNANPLSRLCSRLVCENGPHTIKPNNTKLYSLRCSPSAASA